MVAELFLTNHVSLVRIKALQHALFAILNKVLRNETTLEQFTVYKCDFFCKLNCGRLLVYANNVNLHIYVCQRLKVRSVHSYRRRM